MNDEQPRYRVTVVLDPEPLPPDGDGLPPLVSVSNFGEVKAHYVSDFIPEAIPAGKLSQAFERFDDRDLVERWLRIFHGVTRVDWIDNERRHLYVAFDAPQWRRHIGAEPRDLAGEDLAHDWRAWVNGEVYGIITEVCDRYGQWHEVEAVYGYYGHDYAISQAQDMKKNVAETLARPGDDDGTVEVEFEYTVRYRARVDAGMFAGTGVMDDSFKPEYLVLLRMMDSGDAMRVVSRMDIVAIDDSCTSSHDVQE